MRHIGRHQLTAVTTVVALCIGFGAGYGLARGGGSRLLSLAPAASLPGLPTPTPLPKPVASALAMLPTPSPSPAAWPGPLNTGVPLGTRLTLAPDDFTTSYNGQVVDSMDIRGTLFIKNDNVIVKRTRVTADPTELSPIGIRVFDGHRGIVIQDCEINMGDRPGGTGVGYSGYTIQRCNIHGAMKGIQIGDHDTVLDNWVHDPYTGGTAHSEDVAVFGSDVTVASIVRHNTLSNPKQQTAVVFMKTDQGFVNGMTVDHNLIDGGNYSIYSVVGYWDNRTPPQNVTITNNVFTLNYVYGIRNCDGIVSWSANFFITGAVAL